MRFHSRFWVVFALVVALALPVMVLAGEGSAQKATGGVEAENGSSAQFNAHEAKGKQPAKGRIQISNGEGRKFRCDVKAVRVVGDYAWFAAECIADTEDSRVGQWVFVKVYDNGSPGRKGDRIGWDWDSADEANAVNRVLNGSQPADWWDVIRGNLVVHSDGSGEEPPIPT